MNKMALFFIVVFAGVTFMLIFSNQTGKKETGNPLTLSLTPNPNALATIPPISQEPVVATITPVKEQATDSARISKAIIKTSKGDITIAFFPNDAKNTVANFAAKSQSGFYNNLTFHRVEDWVVQGGDPKGDGRGGGNMPTELNDHPFIIGSVGVARGGDIKISNDSQFFITKKDASWLNGQYTNFGQVTDGMDVVNKMEVGDKILEITVE